MRRIGMDLPSNLHDALSALQAARADVAALESLTAEHALVVEALSANKAKVSELCEAITKADADRLALAQELDALKAQHVDAASKANVIVASLGVEPVAIQSEQVAATKSTEELWAEFHSLSLYERNAFYQKNRQALNK
jgi:hypothetical protein